MAICKCTVCGVSSRDVIKYAVGRYACYDCGIQKWGGGFLVQVNQILDAPHLPTGDPRPPLRDVVTNAPRKRRPLPAAEPW